jgi:hypothetical protein
VDNEGAEIDHLGSDQCHESVLEKIRCTRWNIAMAAASCYCECECGCAKFENFGN